MKRLMIIVCSWMLFIVGARGQDPFNPEGLTGSAGKEFYFAIFNHWLCTSDSNRNFVELMFHSINPTDIDVALPDGSTRKWHIDSNTYQRKVLTHKEISPYTPVHVTSSSPCYLSVWVHGQQGAAASTILPVHLLGTHYMVQGVSPYVGDNDTKGKQFPCGSEFAVVGVADSTTIRVKTRIISEGKVEQTWLEPRREWISEGEEKSFTLSKGELLFFNMRVANFNVTGTTILSDKPVAVFQGNDVAQITDKDVKDRGITWLDVYAGDVEGPDGVWEQARPIDIWGTDFVIAKSALLKHAIAKITASEDNTDVYQISGNSTRQLTTLQSGETYTLILSTDPAALLAYHIKTTKPACCYLYTTGADRNDGVGDPGMAEIVPIDNPGLSTRWVLDETSYNASYKSRLVVSACTRFADYITYNGKPLSAPANDGRKYFRGDSMSTWDIPISSTGPGILKAEQGGFSAYVLHVGEVEEAAVFNVSLPAIIRQYSIDTTICDTMWTGSCVWHGRIWTESGTVTDTLKNSYGEDSVYYHYNLTIELCCPWVRRDAYRRYTLCDSILPYELSIQENGVDTVLYIENISTTDTIDLYAPNIERPECPGINYHVIVQTKPCFREYPILVCKYDQLLLLDYPSLYKLFPGTQAVAFRWYLDDILIENANEDDYSHEDGLHGSYQLCVTLDNKDEVWSNRMEFQPSQDNAPVQKQVYNSQGMPVEEDYLPPGIYLIRYKQGNKMWTEKRFVP